MPHETHEAFRLRSAYSGDSQRSFIAVIGAQSSSSGASNYAIPFNHFDKSALFGGPLPNS